MIKRGLSTVVQGCRALPWMTEGSRKLSKAVQLTLGPGGRTVAIDPFERMNHNELSVQPQPVITKDGVTVAKAINYLSSKQNVQRGRLQNIGAKLFIDAS